MSATCPHPDAEAALHPECAGCLVEFERQVAAAGPLIDVPVTDDEWSAAIDELPRLVEREARDAHDRRQRSVASGLADRDRFVAEMETFRDAQLARINDGLAAFAAYAQGRGREASLIPEPSRGLTTFMLRCAGCRTFVVEHVPDRHFVLAADPRAKVVDVAHNLERLLAARCECILGELLPDRDLTPEERAAHDEAPRPGVWVGDDGADGRELTQDETDGLIRTSLLRSAQLAVALRIRDLIGGGCLVQMAVDGGRHDIVSTDTTQGGIVGRRLAAPRQIVLATRQRGGIDSDPMVRLLAFRAWGDRDRRWFEREGGPSRKAQDSNAYACAECNMRYGMESDEPVTDPDVPTKTAVRYCRGCADAEAAAHGISRERVLEMWIRRDAERTS